MKIWTAKCRTNLSPVFHTKLHNDFSPDNYREVEIDNFDTLLALGMRECSFCARNKNDLITMAEILPTLDEKFDFHGILEFLAEKGIEMRLMRYRPGRVTPHKIYSSLHLIDLNHEGAPPS